MPEEYEEETHILARVRLNQLRVNRQQSGTAFHKRAGAASATNSVSLGCDCLFRHEVGPGSQAVIGERHYLLEEKEAIERELARRHIAF